jgi:hypothetical protein
MSSYTKSTDFASKDSLLTGNPLKVIKGTEINDEFNAIQTAVNSKADTNSPALTGTPTAPTATAGTSTTQIATTAFVTASPQFTGTPTAPTASFGTDNTQLATTAFVRAAIEALYPVGTIYTSTSATNPASTFGFGTWVAFGAGRVLVGQNTSDASFNTLEETGGSKDAVVVTHSHGDGTLATDTEANHAHGAGSYVTNTQGSHNHSGLSDSFAASTDITNSTNIVRIVGGATTTGRYVTSELEDFPTDGAHSHTISGSSANAGSHSHDVTGSTASEGVSGTNKNLQPYIVVKMWKRTA